MNKLKIEKMGSQTYLVMDSGGEEKPFWLSMLEENKIKGILPITARTVDNCKYYCYNITGMQAVEEAVAERPWNYESLYGFLEEIADIMKRGKEYLLEEESYLLNPVWMFWDVGERQLQLVYLGIAEKSFAEQLQELAEFIIRHLNHGDELAKSLGYDFYHRVMEHADVDSLQELLKEYRKESEGKKETPVHFSFSTKKDRVGEMPQKGKTKEVAEEKKWYLAWQQDTRNLFLRFFCGSKSNPLIALTKFPCTIGRDATADYCIVNAGISRSHLKIEKEGKKLYITDLYSHNGTWLNGKRLQAGMQTRFREGDRLILAGEVFRLQGI